MNTSRLIREIANQTGLVQRDVRAVMDAFTEITANAMSNGECVILYGFGTFEPKNRSPRIGRNPHTGEAVEIPARILPSFRPAQVLTEKVSCVAHNSDTKSPRQSPAK